MKLEHIDSKLLILIIGILLCVINLNKAYHIDDAFHLQVAHYLIDHPLEPLSGEVLWDNSVKQIKQSNQPPLIFYYLALIIAVFGENPMILHLSISLFVFPILYYYDNICRLIGSSNSQLSLILFGLSYPFIINQNIMVDVPLLGFMMTSVHYFLKNLIQNNQKSMLMSMACLSLGLLTKYTLLPLLPIYALIILIKKDHNELKYLFIPIAVLFLWSIWNYAEVGEIHLLNRESSGFNYSKLETKYFLGYLSCLGSMCLFAPIFITYDARWVLFFKRMYSLILIGLIALALYLYFEQLVQSFDLSLLFYALGACMILLLLNRAIRFKMGQTSAFIYLTLGLIILGMSLFIILLAPFIASRHLLLVLPFMILLLARTPQFKYDNADKMIISLSVILSLWLSLSDNYTAKFYNIKSKEIAQHYEEDTIHSTGFWGWQWYSKYYGMQAYERAALDVKTADYLVIPERVPHQKIRSDIILQKDTEITAAPALISCISGSHNFGLYWSDHQHSAWNISYGTIDTINVYRVIDGIDLNDIYNRMKYWGLQRAKVDSLTNVKGISRDSACTIMAQIEFDRIR